MKNNRKVLKSAIKKVICIETFSWKHLVVGRIYTVAEEAECSNCGTRHYAIKEYQHTGGVQCPCGHELPKFQVWYNASAFKDYITYKCRTCEGDGEVENDGPKACPTCGGNGYIEL